MIDFPYTVDDEPTDDWKVEQVLHWWLLRANAESEAEYDRIAEGLAKQLDEGKKELWEAHEQVSEIVKDAEMAESGKGGSNSNTNESTENTENVENQNVRSNQQKSTFNSNPTKQKPATDKPDHKPMPRVVAVAASSRPTRNKKATAAVASSTSAIAAPENDKFDTIHIDIIGGPYGGSFYDLQPKTRSHAWLGRSSSTKFKERGISVPQDLEVSTSHGRFESRGGKFYYTDVASTNGSRVNGEECVPNKPYELKPTGMTVLAGQTIMKVTLLKLA